MSINAPQKMGYTIRQKIDICLMAESNPKMTQTDLANWAKKKYHTIRPPSQTTISRILSKKNDLIALKEHEYRLIRRRKSSNLLLREILTEWLYQAIWLNSYISVNNIQLAAVDLWKLLPAILKQGNGQFSHKWCINFLSKLNISQSSLLKNLYKPIKIWDLATERVAFKKFLGNNFKLNDIFYLDEFNLFYKLPLDYHYTSNSNVTFDNKNSITILLTANADGSEKLEPFIIAHYDNMISFQGKPLLKITSKYQIAYKSNKHATLTASLFVDWLSILDKRLSLVGRHIVLILDDCSAHRVANIKLDFIQLVFVRNPNNPNLVFPGNRSKEFENTTESVTVPNSISSVSNSNDNIKFSPMQLGIFKEFKTLYRLQQYILAISLQMKLSSSSGNTCQYLHSKHYSLSMSDVLIMIKNAWANVSVEIIKEAFIASDLLDFELYVQQQFDLLTSANPAESNINNNNNNEENIFGTTGSGTTSNDSTIITSLSNSSESPLLLLNNPPEDSINFNNNNNEGRIWGNTYTSNNNSNDDVSLNKVSGNEDANNATNANSVNEIALTGNNDNRKNNSNVSLNNSSNSGGNIQQHHHGLISNTAIDFKNSESKLIQMMLQFKTFPSQNGTENNTNDNNSPSAINNAVTSGIVSNNNGNAWKLEHLLNLPQEEKLLNYESLPQMIQCCVVDEYEPKEKLPDTPENLATNSSVQANANTNLNSSKANADFSRVDNTVGNITSNGGPGRFNVGNNSDFSNENNKNIEVKQEEIVQPSDVMLKDNLGSNGTNLDILNDIDLISATSGNKKSNMINKGTNKTSQTSVNSFDPFAATASYNVNNNGNIDGSYSFMNDNNNGGNDMNGLNDMNFNGININGTLSSNLGNLGFGIPNNNNGFNNINDDSNNNNFLFSASIPSAEEMLQMYNNVGNTYSRNDNNSSGTLNVLMTEEDKNGDNNDINRRRQNNLIYNQHVNRYTANPLYSEPVKKGNLTSIVTIPDNSHSFGELYRKKRKLDSMTNKDESGNTNERDDKKDDNNDSKSKSLFGYGNSAFGMSVSDSGLISLSLVANSPLAQQNSPLPQMKSGSSSNSNSSGTFQDLRQSATKRANILSTVISAAQLGVFKLSPNCIDELTNEFYNQLSFVENESLVHDARVASGQQLQLQMLIEGLEIGGNNNDNNSSSANISIAGGNTNP